MFSHKKLPENEVNKSTMFFKKHMHNWETKHLGMSAAVLVSSAIIPEGEQPGIDIILSDDMLVAAAEELEKIMAKATDSFHKGHVERGMVLATRGMRTAQALQKLEFEHKGMNFGNIEKCLKTQMCSVLQNA